MAYSAPLYMEVRWRLHGSDEAWSDPRRVSPVSEVVVEELDRTKQYDFEARNVSACGAKSEWVPSTHTVPDVPAGNLTLSDLMIEVDNAAADALAANAELANIASDNVLSQGEKPVVIRDYNVITTEQAGIDAQATAFGITTEKTAYDNAVTALTSYLGTLTSPTAWNNLAGDTTIVGSTFRSKFADVYTSRQALLNAIYAAAKVLAGNAQSTANSAASAAAAAQADANAAIAELDDIASDGKLTADEKVLAKQDYLTVTGEQAGIDGQATAFGITTEKTAYDNAITALKTYLRTTVGVLDGSYNWTGITGTTAITRATWDSNWTSVYTSRQALLNAIYAVAKAKADGAQATANTATGQVTQLPVINGGFDMTPVGYGWTADAGSGWQINTAGNTPGVGPNCAWHYQSTGSGAYRNMGLAACLPGQVYKAQGLIKAVGANGVCYVYISWVDASGNEIGSKPGNVVTGTTIAGSYVSGVAPAGTVYARTCLGVSSGHTTGSYFVDNVLCTQYPSTIGEVPDGGGYLRGVQNTGTAISIPNANFSLPLDGQGNIPGWATSGGLSHGLNTNSPKFGSQYLRLVSSPSSQSNAQCTTSFKVNPGDSIEVSGWAQSLNSVPVYITALFYNGYGTYIGAVQAGTSSTAWTNIRAAGLVPTGAATMQISCLTTPAVGSYAIGNFNEVDIRINDLRVAGSGARLGNQLNAPNSLTMAYGAVNSTASISATSAGVVSISAFTVYMGGTSVHYNAVSNAITGLSSGSTYYIYTHDAGGTGGTKTWLATASLNSMMTAGDDIVLAGPVTIPDTGSTSGGGSTGCPVREAWVIRRTREGGAEHVQAGQIQVGDFIRLVSGRWGRVSHSQPQWEPCVRVDDASGGTLSCSISAPLGRADGQSVLAPESLGQSITTMIDSHVSADVIVHVQPLGERWVQHITVENDFYWTGDAPAHLYSHHNRKLDPGSVP